MDKEELMQLLAQLNVESTTVEKVADSYITYMYVELVIGCIVASILLIACYKIVTKLLEE